METIKKRLSFTSMPVFFNDVKDERFLDKITEGGLMMGNSMKLAMVSLYIKLK